MLCEVVFSELQHSHDHFNELNEFNEPFKIKEVNFEFFSLRIGIFGTCGVYPF